MVGRAAVDHSGTVVLNHARATESSGTVDTSPTTPTPRFPLLPHLRHPLPCFPLPTCVRPPHPCFLLPSPTSDTPLPCLPSPPQFARCQVLYLLSWSVFNCQLKRGHARRNQWDPHGVSAFWQHIVSSPSSRIRLGVPPMKWVIVPCINLQREALYHGTPLFLWSSYRHSNSHETERKRRPEMARPLTGAAAGTLTLTVQDGSSSSSSSSSSRPRETVVLRLSRPKKKVTWKEGTVDNEFLGRKSSKKCCIFHKQKPFDEDDSDGDEDGCGGRSGGGDGADKGHEAGTSGCCSSHGGGH
ncbi:hypothetical protein Taro_045774 [Colocasia esculenta]|uniref:Type 1 phosphatases regulator ypi1 n=1 Tax=Colocasia esculenta TaxID=4460 RepID=A0A843X4P9_COLES|nr:hypothetical protein [Colocasia esculenta]